MAPSAERRLAVLCRHALPAQPAPAAFVPQPTAAIPALNRALQASYDYVVVGAGSAGCVAASRLSEDPNVSVLLVEAGGSNQSFRVRSPLITYQDLQNSPLDWAYRSTAQPHADGRVSHWPRGKCLGGCSSINAMLYVRGDPRNYDHWARQGCEGWGYEDVLPFFKKGERLIQGGSADTAVHGLEGELSVSDMSKYDFINRDACEQFVASCEAAGIPRGDFNGPTQRAANLSQVTVKDGVRCDAYSAFLLGAGAMERPNLTVLTGTAATQVVTRGGEATGVTLQLRPGEPPAFVGARKEVVLSCGAVGTPQLLLLSGIGPRGHLAEHGIACVRDLPVGENLQDHMFVAMAYGLKPGLKSSFSPMHRPLTGGALPSLAKHLLFKTDVMSFPMIQSLAFEHSGLPDFKEEEGNDMQIHYIGFVGGINSTQLEKHFGISQQSGRPTIEEMSPKEGVTLMPTLLLPKSRGTVRLASSSHEQHPVIEPSYLSDPRDMALFVRAVELTRRIARSGPFGEMLAEEFHDSSIPHPQESREYMEELVRRYAVTVYHPVGTAKMGAAGDASAVVDPQLRVQGVRKLRVADASVMPSIVSGNTNAPSIMIGERVADFIRRGA